LGSNPRAVATLLLVVLVTSCQTGPSVNPPSAGSRVIVIGSDLPDSGAYGRELVPLEQAIQLAIEQNPRFQGFTFRYQHWDNALGPTASEEKAVQNIEQMIDDPHVLGVIGPYTSNVAFTTIPVANQASLAMLSPSNSDYCLTRPAPFCDTQPDALRGHAANSYFRVEGTDPAQGTAMAHFAATGLNVRRVAAFNEWGGTGGLVIDAFAAELARSGGELVYREDLPPTSDFTPFLTAAKAHGAEAIYAVGGDQDHVCVARAQMKRAFPQGAFLGTDGIAIGPDCVTDAGENADGIAATYMAVDAIRSTDAAAVKAVAAYRKRFPNSKDLPIFTFATYDCAMILITAIEQAIKANGGRFPRRSQVVDALAHLQYAGVTGTYSFDASGDAVSPLMSLYVVKNNKWVYQQKLDAATAPA
jgi:branched-chain amino acid transport system substrate-binding protein